MAVTSAKLARSGLSGVRAGTNPQGPDVESEYASEYVVKCDSASDGPVTIFDYFRSHAELPYLGRIYQHGTTRDGNAVCTRMRPTFMEKSAEPWVWRVGFDFGPRQVESSTSKPPPGDNNPYNEADDYSCDAQMISVPVRKARYISGLKGTPAARRRPGSVGPVHNSALVTYDPPLEIEVPVKVLRITRSIAQYDDVFWSGFEGRVNSDDVNFSRPAYGFFSFADKYKSRFVGASPSLQFTPRGLPYWRVTWEFHNHPFGWRPEVLDRGLSALAEHGEPNGMGGQFSPGDFPNGVPPTRRLLDAHSLPIAEPVNLDGAGQPLKDGKPAVYLIYATYEEISFAGLLAKIYGA